MPDQLENGFGGSELAGMIAGMSRLRRVPSNRMPSRERTGGTMHWLLGCLFLAGLLGLLGYGLWVSPLFRVIVIVFAIWVWIGSERDQRHFQRLARQRANDSVCSFARSVERRSVDTWIIRATYDVLTEWCGCPVHASDHLTYQLLLDGDDLEFVCDIIADRTGRSLKNQPANPFFDRVVTAADLMHFFQHQPRASI